MTESALAQRFEHCSYCDRDTSPITEMTPSGIVKRCAHDDCRAEMRGEPKAAPVSIRNIADENEEVVDRAVRRIVEFAPTRRVPKPTSSTEGLNPEKLIRERLRFLKAEIARLKALQSEHQKLSRMLRAGRERVVKKATH